tara:strand:+ start:910 stop:1410 length:501 start_codon:yes stop_codon:yes gene_type:complete
MKYLDDVLLAMKDVYASKRYIFFSVIVSFLIFSFNLLINNYRLVFSDFSLVPSLLLGSLSSISLGPLIFIILMSLMAGIVLAFSLYLVSRQMSGASASASGIVVSLIAPACPSCAIGLLSVLGVGGFVSVLPFKGLELGVLGVIILGVSLVYLSKKVNVKVCAIET